MLACTGEDTQTVPKASTSGSGEASDDLETADLPLFRGFSAAHVSRQQATTPVTPLLCTSQSLGGDADGACEETDTNVTPAAQVAPMIGPLSAYHSQDAAGQKPDKHMVSICF